MTLKFYMTPGSCSTGIHILLETLELPFEVTIVNLPAGDHRRPAYRALNPKGTIPALQLDDGRVLTEFQAIAWWLARQHPRARLLPEDPALAAEAIALMDHVVGTVHGQGYTRIFTTDHYLPADLPAAERAIWQAAVQAQGREIVAQAFEVIDARLPEDGYAMGTDFSSSGPTRSACRCRPAARRTSSACARGRWSRRCCAKRVTADRGW